MSCCAFFDAAAVPGLSKTLLRLPPPRCCARQRPLSDGCPRPPPAAPPVFLPILVRLTLPRPPRRLRPSAASICCARPPRPAVALDLALTSVATRRRKIRSTFQNKNKACMKNKTYQRPRPATAPVGRARQLRQSIAPVGHLHLLRPSAAPGRCARPCPHLCCDKAM